MRPRTDGYPFTIIQSTDEKVSKASKAEVREEGREREASQEATPTFHRPKTLKNARAPSTREFRCRRRKGSISSRYVIGFYRMITLELERRSRVVNYTSFRRIFDGALHFVWLSSLAQPVRSLSISLFHATRMRTDRIFSLT